MQQAEEALISMRKLGKVFLTEEVETHALYEVDMGLRRGEFLSIGGPSGCGKSTLLSIMGLLDSASEGEYILKGQEVGELSVRERSRLRRSATRSNRPLSHASSTRRRLKIRSCPTHGLDCTPTKSPMESVAAPHRRLKRRRPPRLQQPLLCGTQATRPASQLPKESCWLDMLRRTNPEQRQKRSKSSR